MNEYDNVTLKSRQIEPLRTGPEDDPEKLIQPLPANLGPKGKGNEQKRRLDSELCPARLPLSARHDTHTSQRKRPVEQLLTSKEIPLQKKARCLNVAYK
jgi:hypothetical protein